MASRKVSRRRFVGGTAALSTAMVAAPFVRGAYAAGKISIGFDGVGTGVSLATLDELVPLGFMPRNFCDTSGNPTASKLYRITRVILAQPDIEGYVFVSCLSSQQLDNTARGIVKIGRAHV